ncbi:sensor histidine kinase [Cohnella caldifontis]|uniref:sensor histidine kinase n=1 Tax=Cohnella caldifontis TaxID=3027471 RepID=UPI0023ED86F0|nr:sensor histidine kinase [Cohnella sp. YIM B05605]
MEVRLGQDWIRNIGTPLLVFLSALLILGSLPKSEPKASPRAVQGVLDLTAWDWERDGTVSLSGQWKFRQLGVTADPARTPDTTLDVPGTWGSLRDGEGRQVPDRGTAQYSLTLKLGQPHGLLALRMPNIATAYELYVDGKPNASRGVVGNDAEHTVPYQKPRIVYLPDLGSSAEIRLTVANYHHRQGGIRTDVILGTAGQIDRLQNLKAAQEYIVFGCLLMIGLYHVGLFALRRKESANLYFAALCLFVALRMGLIGEGFLLGWFPALDWATAIRLEYTSFALSGLAGITYFHKMFPHELRRFWVRAAGAAAVPLVIGIAVLPTWTLSTGLAAYQAYVLALCALVMAGLIVSAVRRREGAWLALIGVAGMAAAVVNDVSVYNGWSRSVDLVPFGLLFLIVMNSFILSLRSARTFARAEQMSAELKEWNERLEEKIAERTDELRKSYETLEAANSGLERMEQSRRRLLGNISHDLRTPITLLQGYLEALRDGVIRDPGQRDSTIRLMLGKVEGLNVLIQDLFELSMLEAGKVELQPVCLRLDDWRDRIAERFDRDLKERGIGFSCTVCREADKAVTAWVDPSRMDRVFANLLFNAARYTPEGGWIRILLAFREGDGRIEIAIEDNGTGIAEEDLPHIFERFYKKDKSRHSSSGGSGLGLAISREIVELHGGTIGAENRPDGGAAFRIRLPRHDSGSAPTSEYGS